jgi:hypothetical protein
MEPKYITIDIKNNPEVLRIIVDTVPYLPGWKLESNITDNVKNPLWNWYKFRNRTPRFFAVSIKGKSISWERDDADENEGPPDVIMDTPSKISNFLDDLYSKG